MYFHTLAKIFLDKSNLIRVKKYDDAKKAATARFRSASYKKVSDLIYNSSLDLSKKLVTKKLINSLPITDYMKQNAMAYAGLNGTTGLSIMLNENPDNLHTDINKTASDPLTSLQAELTGIMGIGKERAKLLISAGLTDIKQLKNKKFSSLLTEETKTFLTLKPMKKIPHEHIAKLEPYILKAATANIKLQITGSYRRKKPFSSDIDLMVVSDLENALSILRNRLSKIFTNLHAYSIGPDKTSFIITTDITDKNGKPLTYKMDAFRTEKKNHIPMLLYSTGSKEFNVIQRGKAKKLGYLLNQKGLFKNNVRITGLKTEKDYFDILNMDYKEPSER